MERHTPDLPPDVRSLASNDEDERVLERIWRALDPPKRERPSYDVDARWDELSRRLELGGADTTESSRAYRRSFDRKVRAPSRGTNAGARRWTRSLAAALVVLALVGVGTWWETQSVTVSTVAGERTTVTLPDGSTAELNGQSSLSYPRGFTRIPVLGETVRRVSLEGEAYFSVVEQDRPFRVETANAAVEVLGTEFTVRSRRDEGLPDTGVTLASGRVRVAPLAELEGASRGPVVLDDRGASTRVTGSDASPMAPTPADLKYVNAWREGGFAMSDARLPSVLRELEYRFGTPLQLGVPPSETETMTLHYAGNVTLKDVLRDICLIQNLSFRETSQGYELVRE